MEAAVLPNDEFCTNCGEWVDQASYNFDLGWCQTCSPLTHACSSCGAVMRSGSARSMCKSCREEIWLIKHGDEVEYLMVTKGYTVTQARVAVTEMIRPICQCCGHVIKFGTPGETLFCKSNRTCHSVYNKYKRLVKKGATPGAALAQLRSRKEREVTSVGILVRVSLGTPD